MQLLTLVASASFGRTSWPSRGAERTRDFNPTRPGVACAWRLGRCELLFAFGGRPVG